MKNIEKTTVSKLVSQNFKTARVFMNHGIDFCCNGNEPLDIACQKNNVNIDEITAQVRQAMKESQDINFMKMTMTELVDYIINNHHTYIKRNVPALLTILEKVVRVHGENHPELNEINKLFKESIFELTSHLEKEEQILFPYIQKLESAIQNKKPIPEAAFGSIQNPIAMMEDEHDKEGNRFRLISDLTNQYTPPKGACQSFQVAYSMLNDFEKDLHKHIHLENNILFTKAIENYERFSTLESKIK